MEAVFVLGFILTPLLVRLHWPRADYRETRLWRVSYRTGYATFGLAGLLSWLIPENTNQFVVGAAIIVFGTLLVAGVLIGLQGRTSILPLERQLLDALLVGDDEVLAALRDQLPLASVDERTFTGSGLMITFTVEPAAVAAPIESVVIGDVVFGIDGQPHRGQALLHVLDGRLHMLEALAVDGKWPWHARLTDMGYFSGAERDLEWLRARWLTKVSNATAAVCEVI